MTQDKDRHAELRAMADRFPGAVVVVGEDGNVLFMNRAAQQLFGKNHVLRSLNRVFERCVILLG